jgi:hypothetical protein
VDEKIRGELLNAATQIAVMAPNERQAVEAAYLTVLTRRPTPEEATHFAARLADRTPNLQVNLEDLFWILLNSTEFAWNH